MSFNAKDMTQGGQIASMRTRKKAIPLSYLSQ